MTTTHEIGDVLFRHGDVLLKKSDGKALKRKALTKAVLHKGQNHEHTIKGKFYIREKDGQKYVGLLGPCTLGHAEHGPLKMTPKQAGGELLVAIQNEYDHLSEESRKVID